MQKDSRYAVYSDESEEKPLHVYLTEAEAKEYVESHNNAQIFGFPDERIYYSYQEVSLVDIELTLIHDFLQQTALLQPYINQQNLTKKANEILQVIKDQ